MGSFKTKPKAKQDGTFWGCKKCQKVPTKDQDIFMENLGTKEAPNWIACLDEACFLSQGGHKVDPNASGYKKAKTPKELMEYRKECSNLAWDIAKEKAQHIIGNMTTEEKFKMVYEALMSY